ncbi:hypothetical protein ACFRIC_40040 [Streptomyces sp. NPDC056738]|uniref:hypothetical protein n=1 Tax=Streptomyces sp. NPDC056738 TaxID=3345933 RepID=UPI0036A87CB1
MNPLLVGTALESRGRLGGRVPVTMTAVPAVLLVGALAAGLVPDFPTRVGETFEAAKPLHWTLSGLVLGISSAALTMALTARGRPRPGPPEAARLDEATPPPPLGHIGDYVAWLLTGITWLGALALPGVLAG